MRILVDAMGGDLAPDEIVKGAVHAQQELGAEIVLVGQRAAIEACLRNEQAKLEIIDASEVITMDDDPSTATRRKKDASMTVALNMLRDGKGDAVVSAGSTGALLTGATLIVKRIHGIRRAALAPVLPNGDAGVMLIDCGANADCTPEYLLQFAYMGSYYARTMLGIAAPRVGLLSNGTEDHKGSELQHETFPLLKAADAAGRIRFIGNVEASQVFSGDVDVVVTDGFTGNVLLNGADGTAVDIILPANVEQLVGTAETVHIKMDQLAGPFIFVHDRERRARDAARQPHAAGHAAHKGGLSAAELAVHGHDLAVRQGARKVRAGLFGLRFAVGQIFLHDIPPILKKYYSTVSAVA